MEKKQTQNKINQLMVTASHSQVPYGSHSKTAFEESALKLSQQIGLYGINEVNSDILDTTADFLDKLNLFLSEVNQERKELYKQFMDALPED